MADSSHVIDQRSLDLLASLPFADHGIPASQPASQPASHHASQPASIHATQLDQATMRPYSLEDYDEALQRDQAILSARFKENPKVCSLKSALQSQGMTCNRLFHCLKPYIIFIWQ